MKENSENSFYCRYYMEKQRCLSNFSGIGINSGNFSFRCDHYRGIFPWERPEVAAEYTFSSQFL